MKLPSGPLAPRGRPPKPGSPKYEEYMARVEAARKGSPVVTVVPTAVETDDQIINRIRERFQVMEQITKAAIAGGVRSIIVSGAPGVGKTYTISKILEDAKNKLNIRYQIERGCISPVNLFAQLYRFSGPKDVLVLDDSDGVFGDETALALLKAAMDTGAVRRLTYRKNSKFLKDEDIPQEFLYEGTIIFITNMNMQAIVDSGNTKMTAHLNAVMNRAMYLDLKIHTPREMMVWIKYIIPKQKILVKLGLSEAQQNEVLNWMTTDAEALRFLSIRTAEHIGGIMLANPKDWQKPARVLFKR